MTHPLRFSLPVGTGIGIWVRIKLGVLPVEIGIGVEVGIKLGVGVVVGIKY